MAAGNNIVFKIAAKPLQKETWLLFTAYVNSSSPYPTIPLLTPYDVSLSQDTARLAQRTGKRKNPLKSSKVNNFRAI